MNREQIRDAILSMYPDARIENDLFLNEEVLKDFSLEDIAYRLSGLIYGDNLYKYLYGDNSFDKFYSVRRDMVKYIVINNIDYFSLDSKDLFYRKKILMEYERLYGSLNLIDCFLVLSLFHYFLFLFLLYYLVLLLLAYFY